MAEEALCNIPPDPGQLLKLSLKYAELPAGHEVFASELFTICSLLCLRSEPIP